MNWMCDVYVYEHCGGWWQIHVAGRRKAIPPIPQWPYRKYPKFHDGLDDNKKLKYKSKWHEMAQNICIRLICVWDKYLHRTSFEIIPYRELNYGYEGADFECRTPADCASFLKYLNDMGYNVPQDVIESLINETSYDTNS